MQDNGFDTLTAYCHNVAAYGVGTNLWVPLVGDGGYDYIIEGGWGYPCNIIFDRDGNARYFGIGAMDGNPDPWEQVIKELTGAI